MRENVYSVIDIGSNSIRLTVYECPSPHQISVVFRTKDITGLAGFVNQKGELVEEGMVRASEVLQQYRHILDHLRIEKRAVFATASLRNIVNTDEALRFLQESSGFAIEVISGEREAILGYRGATSRHPRERGQVVDIGGGSTEVTYFDRNGVIKAVSLPVGSLNLFRTRVKKLLPRAEERDKIVKKVQREWKKAQLPRAESNLLCAIGGTARGAGRLARSLYRLPRDNSVISLEMLDEMLDTLRREGRQTLCTILKAVPERVHTIVPGMLILSTVAHQMGCDTIEVGEYGVREGYLLEEMLPREQRKKDESDDKTIHAES